MGYASADDLKNLSLSVLTANNPWYSAQGVYVIPDGQTKTRFAFVSTQSPSNGWGNLLDSITFSTLIGNLDAVRSGDDVIVTGYWGETN